MKRALAALGADNDEHGLLAAVGLSPLEERIYRDVVQSGGGTMIQIAERLHVSERRAREAVSALEGKGLLGRSYSGQYLAAPPESALEILILRRSEELERVRLLAGQLKPAAAPRIAGGTPDDVVELIDGWDAITNRHYQLMLSARHELMGFAVGPIEPITAEFTKFKLSLLERGIKARGLCTPAVLQAPGFVDFAVAAGRAGEQTRTASDLPMPMLIADRRSALVPVVSRGSQYLALKAPAVVDALVLLFEKAWASATPFQPGRGVADRAPDEPLLSDDDRRLLSLLATGLKDSAIASVLNMGQRTVERRVRHIMDLLGTQSRFQTGVEAARRGWLDSHD